MHKDFLHPSRRSNGAGGFPFCFIAAFQTTQQEQTRRFIAVRNEKTHLHRRVRFL